jgi:hypothetical protein
MDLIPNIAPVAVALLVCGIAWISVRHASRKAMVPPPKSPPEVSTAAE